MFLLAIDPSIRSLGYALFDIRQQDVPKRLIKSGTIIIPKPTTPTPDAIRIKNVITGLHNELATYLNRIYYIVIEQPESWGAYKSMASTHSGSLLILHLLVGALLWWGYTLDQSHGHSYFIKVSEWKGQLPKHITRKRMALKYLMTFKTLDESDAVGLGDFFLEKRKEILNDATKVESVTLTEIRHS